MWKTVAALALFACVALGGVTVGAQSGPPAATASFTDSLIKGFGITLVLGDVQSGPSEGLAPEAAKALTDLKDFLPYKSYRVLDKIWRLGIDGTRPMLQGQGGQQFQFFMNATNKSSRVASVSTLELKLADHDPKVPFMQLPSLISTAFQIEVGETVVVGTSRLEGGRALILLVTAVPR